MHLSRGAATLAIAWIGFAATGCAATALPATDGVGRRVPIALPTPRVPLAPGSRLIGGADLLTDVTTLRATFEALHPGLRRYNAPAQLDSAYAESSWPVKDGATLADALRAFAVFTAKLRCGHTFLNPSNQSEDVRRAMLSAPRLPIHFRWIERRMIVTESLAPQTPLQPGTEVVAINGSPTGEIFAKLLTVARADGANDDKRIANIERRGLDRYEPFDVAFALFFPPLGNAFVLDLIDPAGVKTRVSVPGLVATGGGESRDGGAAAAVDAPLWSLRFLDETTGYLEMRTWVTYDTKWDWKGDLQRAFVTLEKRHATTLIVDLRGNEGGSDVGDVILGHYLAVPLKVDGLERWTRYRAVPDALRPNLDTWDKSFFDWGESATPLRDGFFRLTKYDDAPGGDVLAPLTPRARAKLVVLVDGANSSATFQFAQLVQRQRIGTLVGEPTGGNQRGINGGAFFFLHLPKSGIEIDLPLIGRFPADGHVERLPDAGLTPDVLVRTTPADIAAGRDPQLAASRSYGR